MIADLETRPIALLPNISRILLRVLISLIIVVGAEIPPSGCECYLRLVYSRSECTRPLQEKPY